MAITYKRTDDLEKVLETFATLPELEQVQFPDPKSAEKAGDDQEKQEANQTKSN